MVQSSNMQKKKLNCYEYDILLKQNGDDVDVVVNGENFIKIEDINVLDLADKKIIDFTSINYEKWAFGETKTLKSHDFVSDGSTCKDGR
jgi:hypothetical protein